MENLPASIPTEQYMQMGNHNSSYNELNRKITELKEETSLLQELCVSFLPHWALKVAVKQLSIPKNMKGTHRRAD